MEDKNKQAHDRLLAYARQSGRYRLRVQTHESDPSLRYALVTASFVEKPIVTGSTWTEVLAAARASGVYQTPGA